MNLNWRVFAVTSLLFTVCNAYKVLLLAPINGKSHFMYMSSFVKAALDRGHEVTFLTSNTLSHLKLANYTEVLVDPPFDMLSTTKQEDLIKFSNSMIGGLFFFPTLMSSINEYYYNNPNVQKFMKSTGHFDVIVSEEFYSDSLLMLAHKYKAPIVSICAYGVPEFIDHQQGLLTPPSFVPNTVLPYSDNMSFTERWYNSFFMTLSALTRDYLYIPSEEKLVKKYFADYAPLPPLTDIIRNISVVLANTHRAIAPPRPSMPSVIPIGGAHIKPAKPVPKDMKDFLDGAKHGAIYFSLGSNLKSSQLPANFIRSFLDTFKNIKQRVLWKFEDDSLTDIPSNVMIRKWMPQNDILGHPNVILFISHGGGFGTTESLYHGVPMILIPFFGDQIRNAHRIAGAGYGKVMQYHEITKELFSKLLNEILSDESYLQKARQTSEVFRDNLVHPMDEAMFWIEHVAKFKGAKHLKSHAVNMSWFTYLSLDVLLINVLAVLFVLFVLRAIFKKLFGRKEAKTISKQKKQK